MRQIMPAAPTHAGGGLRAEEATLTTSDGRSGDWCARRPPDVEIEAVDSLFLVPIFKCQCFDF